MFRLEKYGNYINMDFRHAISVLGVYLSKLRMQGCHVRPSWTVIFSMWARAFERFFDGIKLQCPVPVGHSRGMTGLDAISTCLLAYKVCESLHNVQRGLLHNFSHQQNLDICTEMSSYVSRFSYLSQFYKKLWGNWNCGKNTLMSN